MTTAAEIISALTKDLATITRHYNSAIDAAAMIETAGLDAELDLSLATVSALSSASHIAEVMNALARRATDGLETERNMRLVG
jgi:hypothetical protein